MEGFKQIVVICGEVSKPHYIWGFDSSNQKVLKKVPTIPDPVYPDMVGMGAKDVLVIRETIEEVMVDFEANGFVMPEPDTWDYPERSIRVDISNDDLLKMIGHNPQLLQFQEVLGKYIVSRNNFRFIYLEKLEDSEIYLFNQKELYPSVIIHE